MTTKTSRAGLLLAPGLVGVTLATVAAVVAYLTDAKVPGLSWFAIALVAGYSLSGST